MPISADILRPYVQRHRVFIETGTHVGDGVQAALDAGFKKIRSCDLDIERVRARFALDAYVWLCESDSCSFLSGQLQAIHEPAIFWLDAHATDGGGGSYSDCPLLGELAEIAKHPIKTHTILIDDIRLVGSGALRLDDSTDNYSMWKLMDAIRAINPDYRIRLIHSPLFSWDIMECSI